MVLNASPGTTDTLTIGGRPAVYFRAESTMHPGNRSIIPDMTQRELALNRDGTMMTIHG